MNIQPIRTESDYENALREISAYVDNEPEPGIRNSRNAG